MMIDTWFRVSVVSGSEKVWRGGHMLDLGWVFERLVGWIAADIKECIPIPRRAGRMLL